VDENRTRASRPQAADFDAVKQEPRNGIPNQSAQSAPPLSQSEPRGCARRQRRDASWLVCKAPGED